MPARETVLGLDVGRSSIKAAWVEKRGDEPTVTRTEHLVLPAESGEQAAVISKWIEQNALARHPCVLGLRGELAMFQPFVLPAGDPRTIEQAVAMEVLRFNEMASETMVHGYAPVAVNEHERHLLLALARPSVLGDQIAFAQDAGLDVLDVVPSPVALFRALGRGHSSQTPVLFVNIGHTATEIAIGFEGGLLFARSFAGGGQMFTEAVAKAAGLSSARAENLKLAGNRLPDGSAPADSFGPVVDLWLSEMQSCLSVYESVFPSTGLRPEQAVLVGDGSRLDGLADSVAEGLKLEIVAADSLPGTGHDAGRFAIAAGLGICGLERHGKHISLLPAQMRDELVFRRQKPFWIAAAVCAALVLAVSLAGGFRDYRRRAAVLAAQRTSLRHREELVQQIEAVKTHTRTLCNMAEPVRALVRAGPLMRDIITLVAESASDDDRISMICDADSYFDSGSFGPPPEDDRRASRRNPPDPAERQEPGVRRVLVEGATRTWNLTSVERIIDKLNAADFVESADLLGDDQILPESEKRARQSDHRGRVFVIDVRIRKL